MKKKVLIAFISILITSMACVPYIVNYKHIVLLEQSGLEVIQNTKGDEDGVSGVNQWYVKDKVPLEYKLKRPSYTLGIRTKLKTHPDIEFNIENSNFSDKNNLILSSYSIKERSYDFKTDWKYAFELKEYPSLRKLVIEIINEKGEIIGVETLKFKVKSRVVGYTVDAI